MKPLVKKLISGNYPAFDKDQLRLKNLLKLLEIPKGKRNYLEMEQISNIISEFSCFQDFKDTAELVEISKEIYKKFVATDFFIFRKREVADCIFILLSGSACEYQLEVENMLSFQKETPKKIYGIGDVIGEFEVNNNDSKRDTTAIANEDCELLVVERETMQKFMKSSKSENYRKSLSFFKQLPIFSNVSTDILEDLAMKSFMKNIISNTIVAKQDESPLLIYFVYNGRLKVIKSLQSEVDKDPLLLEISELGIADCFCLKEIVLKEKMQVSIIAEVNTVLVAILGTEFNELIEDGSKEMLKFTEDYPNKENITEMFQEITQWNKFKRKTVENVQIYKKNKKNLGLNRNPIIPPHQTKGSTNIKDINNYPSLTYCKMNHKI